MLYLHPRRLTPTLLLCTQFAQSPSAPRVAVVASDPEFRNMLTNKEESEAVRRERSVTSGGSGGRPRYGTPEYEAAMGYNVGDMLGAPSMRRPAVHLDERGCEFWRWGLRRHRNFPSSILHYVYSAQGDSPHRPTVAEIRAAVGMYIRKNNPDLRFVGDPGTLFVHFRSGDKGSVSDRFLSRVASVMREKKFTRCIALIGVHPQWTHGSEDNVYNAIVQTINQVCKSVPRLSFLLSQRADDHICVMASCRNLFVHRGGFSCIGALVCRGRVYATSEFTHLGVVEAGVALTKVD